jgi:SAM-dependent methyltransferase
MGGDLIKKILGFQHPHDRVVEIFKSLGYRGRLLDAPAGTGAISQKLKEAGFSVVAADINPHFFSVQGIPCKEADLNKELPFEDETFDFILCSNGIEHLEAPYHFIRECYRLLKDRGKILITTPNVLNLKSRMANLLIGFNLFTGRPSNEVDDYSGGDHIHLTDYYELRVNHSSEWVPHLKGNRPFLQPSGHAFCSPLSYRLFSHKACISEREESRAEEEERRNFSPCDIS